MKAMSESAAEIVGHVRSGQRVFLQGGAATPQVLIDALVKRAPLLKDVELIHMHTEGPAHYAEAEFAKSFSVANLFVGPNVRPLMDKSRVDYLPCFLTDIPRLFRSNARPIDVAMLHLSPPDKHGYCTLGTSVDIARAAFEVAKLRLAQINVKMPRVHGDSYIHIDDLDHFVEVDEPLHESEHRQASSEELRIADFVAGLVGEGACLQIGIGSIPNAVLQALKHHRHLGIHSEMWSDGALALMLSGAVDNSKKQEHQGKTVSSFIIGSRAVYDFIDDNPSIIQLGTDFVNDPATIARNPNVVAVNSAVEIDLTGQVCADSVGGRIISGVGGQMDFMRGAALSKGGKSIIAMTSRSKKGRTRIVSALAPNAGVVTTRADVHYVVTEYGIADLFGKTLHERAEALIAIAHPEHREALALWAKP